MSQLLSSWATARTLNLLENTTSYLFLYLFMFLHLFMLVSIYTYDMTLCSDLYISEGLSSFNSIVSPADPGTGGVIWFLLYIHGYYERCGSTDLNRFLKQSRGINRQRGFVCHRWRHWPKTIQASIHASQKASGLLDTRSEASAQYVTSLTTSEHICKYWSFVLLVLYYTVCFFIVFVKWEVKKSCVMKVSFC